MRPRVRASIFDIVTTMYGNKKTAVVYLYVAKKTLCPYIDNNCRLSHHRIIMANNASSMLILVDSHADERRDALQRKSFAEFKAALQQDRDLVGVLDGGSNGDGDSSTTDVVLLPITLRTDTVSIVKRVIELLVVQWAVEYARLIDRMNDIVLVFILFMLLVLVSSYVTYKCDDWKRRLKERKAVYSQKKRVLREHFRALLGREQHGAIDKQPLPPLLLNQEHKGSSNSKLIAEKLDEVLIDAQIEDEPSGIMIVEYFLDLASYLIHLAKLFFAFLLMKLIQEYVEGSGATGSNRFFRVIKPLMIILIIYAEFTMSGNREAFNV